jgi:PiT family inorganic phosphate transporter
MIFGLSILLVIIIIGFYMAWNIGANDLANSMASAVGAKALKLRSAVILGGIIAFCGAVFVGSNVSDTVKSGIVDPSQSVFQSNPELIIFGAIAALLGASFWITVATWKELPISTTHSIVGGMMGFGIAAGGVGIVNWFKIGSIVASWVISPVLGGFIAYGMFNVVLRFILRHDEPARAANKISPILIGITVLIVISSVFFKTPAGNKLGLEFEYLLLLAIVIAIICGYIGRIAISSYFKKQLLKKDLSREESYQVVEKIFKRLQIITSCYIAFALGANDVANAIGPVSAAWSVELSGAVGKQVEVPLFLLVLGGIGIITGMMTWGYKVIKTIGTRITELTNTRGFSIDFGAATSVLIASKLGMPVSTTHAVVGAVIGVGLARGLGAIDLSIIKKIIVTWVVTVPIAAFTAGGIFLMLSTII